MYLRNALAFVGPGQASTRRSAIMSVPFRCAWGFSDVAVVAVLIEICCRTSALRWTAARKGKQSKLRS